MNNGKPLIALATALIASTVHGKQDIELDTTRIKSNEELPQILYIVPWKELEPARGRQFKLHLHDFFGELYQPQMPALPPGSASFSTAEEASDQESP